MDKQQLSVVEDIYRQHKDHIYNYIHRMCNDADLSHDIVQSTFIKLLSDTNVAGVEHLKAYLFTIARNTLFDEVKRKKPVYFESSEQAEEAAGIGQSVDSLHDSAEEQILTKAIDKAITHMPEKFRELMLLRYTEDLTIQEIAEITHRNISDIKVNLHRARLAFENRFTATMYTKVAASRKRCDTLIGMIASYGDADIPMGEIPKIETHIAKCANCNEDATQMKRRRELFALLPLLIAPELWHDIVKEAQASDLPQDTGSGTGTTSGQPATTKTAADTATTVAKVSAVKLASMAAVVIAVVFGSVVLWQRYPLTTPPPVSVPENPAVNATPPPSGPPPSGVTPSTVQPPVSPSNANPGNTANVTTATGTQNPANNNTPAATATPPSSGTPAPSQIAKAASPNSVAQNPASPQKSTPDISSFWRYDGPPMITTEENTNASETIVNVNYKSQYGYRTESFDKTNNSVLINIINFSRKKRYVLVPEKKVYLDLKVDDKGHSAVDPLFDDHEDNMDSMFDKKPCEKFDRSQRLGTETLEGRAVEKWGCMLSKNENTTVQWYDPARKLVVGEDNYTFGKTVVKNITEQSIDKSMFELPKDFKEIGIRDFYNLYGAKNQ